MRYYSFITLIYIIPYIYQPTAGQQPLLKLYFLPPTPRLTRRTPTYDESYRQIHKTKYGKWRIYDLHVEHVYFPYTSSYGNILLNYQRVYLKMLRRVSLSRASCTLTYVHVNAYDTSNTPPNNLHTRPSLLVCASNDLMFWKIVYLWFTHADFPYSCGNILSICQRVYPKNYNFNRGNDDTHWIYGSRQSAVIGTCYGLLLVSLPWCMSFFICQCRALHQTFSDAKQARFQINW